MSDQPTSRKVLQAISISYLNERTRGMFWPNLTRPSGSATILGVLDGRAIAIQIKSPKKNLRQSQMTFSDNYRRAGGLYYVVSTIEDLRQLVGVNAWYRDEKVRAGLSICAGTDNEG